MYIIIYKTVLEPCPCDHLSVAGAPYPVQNTVHNIGGIHNKPVAHSFFSVFVSDNGTAIVECNILRRTISKGVARFFQAEFRLRLNNLHQVLAPGIDCASPPVYGLHSNGKYAGFWIGIWRGSSRKAFIFVWNIYK